MPNSARRAYKSLTRQRQAHETRSRIVEATRHLLEAEGYAGTTVDAIARQAEVSVQTVYAVFGSKTGILAELLNQSTFGADYEDTVRQTLEEKDPEMRLRGAARIARQIHDAQREGFDLLRGAGVVAPELARLEQERERIRYERQEQMIVFLSRAKSLRPDLNSRMARDIFWTLTGSDIYRMLVRERGWSSQKYQNWLADTLVRSLLN
ncbi:TetR/AcrR family transcriptional regulator [Occallatibacter riparius]|uniref:TetR/AcrR family transcriptional regulator n=1 Tax=Occallatibacter riparius TaxID=1002689 RepID=A0A9J7BTD5_9BACT|nr:TetR/AcrR family transcriptional regulator [Occallatibacter riparius]UWZ84166.1 TetR/AcrR family transcriptional regulator [Occallatibacter riparius]